LIVERIIGLPELLTLSEEMLEAAKKHQWEKLQEQDKELKQLMQRIFPIKATLSNAESIRQLVQKVIDNNQAISELVTPIRNDIKVLLAELAPATK